jgi:molecular chaperone GrpE
MAGRGAGDLDDYAEVAAAAAAGGLAGPADDGAQEASAADLAELARLQEEIDGLNDRHLRLAAEFDNYRKRIERERAEQHTRSQASLAGRLLDALDDLQRVEHFDPASVSTESLLEALALVERKFRQALEAAGLEEVLAQGEIFDPNTMEAVMTAPAEHPEEDEVVADVFRKGYRFGNTLVRPAQVRVKKYED